MSDMSSSMDSHAAIGISSPTRSPRYSEDSPLRAPAQNATEFVKQRRTELQQVRLMKRALDTNLKQQYLPSTRGGVSPGLYRSQGTENTPPSPQGPADSKLRGGERGDYSQSTFAQRTTGEIRAVEDRNRVLEQQITKLEQERDWLAAKNSELETDLAGQKKEVDRVSREHDEGQYRMQQADREAARLSEEGRFATLELEEKKRELMEKNKELAALEIRANKERLEKQRLEEELQVLRESGVTDQGSAEAEHLETVPERERLEEQVEHLSRENAKLGTKLAKKEESENKLKQRLAKAEQDSLWRALFRMLYWLLAVGGALTFLFFIAVGDFLRPRSVDTYRGAY